MWQLVKGKHAKSSSVECEKCSSSRGQSAKADAKGKCLDEALAMQGPMQETSASITDPVKGDVDQCARRLTDP